MYSICSWLNPSDLSFERKDSNDVAKSEYNFWILAAEYPGTAYFLIGIPSNAKRTKASTASSVKEVLNSLTGMFLHSNV